MIDIVECHSEFEYPEKPVVLTWQGQHFQIQAILSQWRTPQGKGFRVQTDNGQTFIILYDIAADMWHIDPS
jgi:hypothetical protein